MTSEGKVAAADAPPVVARPAFVLDYDGTLAPIVDDPEQARPHPQVPGLLTRLADRYPVLIVTGRQVSDLARLLPVPGLEIVGVHGSQSGRIDEARNLVVSESSTKSDLLEEVAAKVPDLPGIRLEPKGAALAIHYRGAADEDGIEARLRTWATSLPESVESMWGKKLLEVRLPGFDKGRSAGTFAGAHPDTETVVIGDDTTDEDAFKALPHAVTVKVGPGATSARFRLPDVDAVVTYLSSYLAT